MRKEAPPSLLIGEIDQAAGGNGPLFWGILRAMRTVREPSAGKGQIVKASAFLEGIGINPNRVAEAESLIDSTFFT